MPYFCKLIYTLLFPMISFFIAQNGPVLAVKTKSELSKESIKALEWLFNNAKLLPNTSLDGIFIGPRKEMITPWSTSAVEIAKNMNIGEIERIEEFYRVDNIDAKYDKMLQRLYQRLDQSIFDTDKTAEPVLEIENIEEYNNKEGLALNQEEIDYLKNLSIKLQRPLTDGEVFGFSQVNSEHCRHKIFNGVFVIDGVERESSLFSLIKKTSKENPNKIVSAYKDNCAFLKGPQVELFYPIKGDAPSEFTTSNSETVISLKAETHNFPTTVEPFNGAATGSGGEIRDRIAGGKGSFPIAGTAVYMTSYPRLDPDNKIWEQKAPRKWLYQTPKEILIKASNGASDYGNKFGQPLICGSLLTYEYSNNDIQFGYDKVIMQAGGIGYAKKDYAFKDVPKVGDKIVLLGGDNYRIGMGGGAVSSVATGEFNNSIELNAVQRSNPEMQKRVYNTIRSLAESNNNSIISIHDHGAGGHLNCLSELVEETGGLIDIGKLPKGDPTLSAKELIGNESQERMGMVVSSENCSQIEAIAQRERAPFYVIGETTNNKKFTLQDSITKETPIDLNLEDMFGSTPKTVLTDTTILNNWEEVDNNRDIEHSLELVLQLESVACKDWLTNKVDRSVTGLIAKQQTAGEIQLPLNNLGVVEIGYGSKKGMATSIGHAPSIALIDERAGSRMAIAETLTNLIWTPIESKIEGVSLSANWMWPCNNPGENTKLYNAVESASNFAIELGINIPTGKDSLSMTQKYPDGSKVISPGTLIVSSVCEVTDITKTIEPVIDTETPSTLLYIPFNKLDEITFELGGSAYAQVYSKLGQRTPDIKNAPYFKECFNVVQDLINSREILAGHDVSTGGLITTLLEMNFANCKGGIDIDLTDLKSNLLNILFSEESAIVIQVADDKLKSVVSKLIDNNIQYTLIGTTSSQRFATIRHGENTIKLDIDKYRDLWFKPSYMLDIDQVGEKLATERFNNYKNQPLQYRFPSNFNGLKETQIKSSNKRVTAAIIREKGSNGDREMAWALHLAGFTVKDVHMTDLISGRENLEDVNMIVFVGGFSNADTLGSAKGWAGAFLYNQRASQALENFYSREDTLSLGVCNGCQLMAELGLITPDNREESPKMHHNNSKKYESAFVGVTIQESPSILLKSLEGSSLGIWVAHGEGKFYFPSDINNYNIAIKYNFGQYPANPNGSPESTAAVCSNDGRHLAMMPHPERCLYPHNWAHYPNQRQTDDITPWLDLFTNGYKWILNTKK